MIKSIDQFVLSIKHCRPKIKILDAMEIGVHFGDLYTEAKAIFMEPLHHSLD